MAAFVAASLCTALDGIGRNTDANTAADKTYDPCGYVAPGVARYEDRSSGIAAAFPSFTLSLRRPTKVSPIFRMSSKLIVPTMEVVNASTYNGITPAPTKAYENMAVLDVTLHQRSTSSERAILLNLLRSLLLATIKASDDTPSGNTNSPVVSAILSLESPY